MDCVFCKIIAGELPCDKVFENDKALVIRDIHPQAPVHALVIPKRHYADLEECAATRNGIISNLVEAAIEAARAEGIAEGGYRLVANTGRLAGQSVGHFHFHLLGGAELSGGFA